MLTTSVDAARYRNKVSPGSGATSTDRKVRCFFSSWKAYSAYSVQVNEPDLLSSLKKGSALSASLEMKQLRAAKDPMSTSRRPHCLDCFDLGWIGFDAPLRDQEPE